MEDNEKIIRFAKRKHFKELKRKGKKYNPRNWDALRSHVGRATGQDISAPINFSIINNTDEVVHFFDSLRYHQTNRSFVKANLRGVEYTDLATVSVLMAHMYDDRLPWGYLTVMAPINEQPRAIFKKVEFDETVTKRNSDKAHFLSRSGIDDNREHKEAVLQRVQKFNSGLKDTLLNPLLTEILSNTNNHADYSKTGVVPWLITMEEDESKKEIKFCVIDLGVGIYERLVYTDRIIKRRKIVTKIQNFFRQSQNSTLSFNIPKGLLSSTKLSYRGQGMKNIYNIANNQGFTIFKVITNKAHVNLKNKGDVTEDAVSNFRGTLYYWTRSYE